MAFTISVVGILLFFVDFGFSQSPAFQRYLTGCYIVVLVVGVLATLLRYANREKSLKRSVLLFDTLSILLTMAILIVHFFGERAQQQMSILYDDNLLKFTIILTFIREFSELNIRFKQTVLNPAQLFILSFLTIILVGALLLMLPNATHDGLSFIDALFTSTSAVCVTGLLVVDTASHFTLFGQIIILFLIQTGGLGILTFANYFSYFFKGGATYETQLTISGMTGSNKLGEVFSTLKRIILITFSIELFTAVLLYLSLDPNLFKSFFEQVFFSVFHAVSAFCNAGFSTLTQGLYDLDFRFNYVFQIIIMMAFVLGGLGFPIVVNLLKYIRYYIKRKFFYFSGRKEMHIPWIINLNSRITLATTTILTIVGTSVFFIVEYSNTLAEHKGIGKFITALFSATTPRTAGFNT
ncbi:MAG TPA: potassium transporter TrkG, partial [Aquaticitalea sp.]|nr:potassium transporter TrkG [Aquaticitalea sp.]